MSNGLIKYATSNGEVALNPQIVRNYISNNPKVTDGEVAMFMELCKYQQLNPFTREVYLVKYGDSPAQTVVSASVMNKRAKANPLYRGEKSGITVEKDGNIERRRGTLMLNGENLIGGWCEVYVEGYVEPIFAEVPFSAFNKGQAMWKTMPTIMIHKTACATAWRSAFPNDFTGLYVAEEMPVDVAKLPTEPIDVKDITDEPEYITDDEYRNMVSELNDHGEKWAIASEYFINNGIMAKHPKFPKQAYRAITTKQYNALMDLAKKHEQKVIAEEEVPFELGDSWEPEPVAEVTTPTIDVTPVVEHIEDKKLRPNSDMTLTFGANKGKALHEINDPYLEWLVEQPVKEDRFTQSNIDRNNKIKAYLGMTATKAVADDSDIPLPFDL